MNHLKARVKYGTKIKPKKGTAFGPKTRTKIERPKATTNRPKFQKLRPQESAKQSSLPIKTLGNKTDQKPLSTTLPVQASLDLKVLNGQQRLLWMEAIDGSKKISLQNGCATSGTIAWPCHTSHLGHKQTKTNFRSQVHQGVLVILVAQLVSRHSCVADRLPVVVRFPAGPRVRLKTVDPPKGNGLGQKKRRVWVGIIDPSSPNRLLESDTHAALCKLGSSSLHRPPFHCQCHHPHPSKCQPLHMPWRPKT